MALSRRNRSAGSVAWLHVSGPSRPRLQGFYEKVLGREAVGPFGEGPVAISESRRPPSPGTAPVTVFFTVPNIDRALARGVRAGGTVTLPVVELPASGGRIAALRDPEGHELHLFEPAPSKTKGARVRPPTSPRTRPRSRTRTR